MKNKSVEELKIEFIDKISKYKSLVESEMLKEFGEKKLAIVEGLSEVNADSARYMLDLQLRKGSFSRKDLRDIDLYRIQTVAKKFKISNKQAISHFISNDNYLSPETVEVNNIISLIKEILEVYNNIYSKFGYFPINALSQKSRDYLTNKKIFNLGLLEKFKCFLCVYIPEISEINVIEKSYVAVPQKPKNILSEDNKRHIIFDIEWRFLKAGKIDDLFKPENRRYLDSLLKLLAEQNITFEEFASQNGLDYTRCYKVNTAESVFAMINHYYRIHNSYRGISRLDPYIRQKIDTYEEQSNLHNLNDLLKSFGIKNGDNFNNCQELPNHIIKERDKIIDSVLIDLYPDKIIEEGFSIKQPFIYEEICRLSKRLGFESVDDYFDKKGYKRGVSSNRKKVSKNQIVLTERDLREYDIINAEKEDYSKLVDEFGVSLLDVEKNRATYEYLIGECQDSSRNYKVSQKDYI